MCFPHLDIKPELAPYAVGICIQKKNEIPAGRGLLRDQELKKLKQLFQGWGGVAFVSCFRTPSPKLLFQGARNLNPSCPMGEKLYLI
jgi:hypothetical protein